MQECWGCKRTMGHAFQHCSFKGFENQMKVNRTKKGWFLD